MQVISFFKGVFLFLLKTILKKCRIEIRLILLLYITDGQEKLYKDLKVEGGGRGDLSWVIPPHPRPTPPPKFSTGPSFAKGQ